jgi:hypothetical protein
MSALTAETPFIYKDPRFSATLPLWEPLLPPDTLRVVVFRTLGATQKGVDNFFSRMRWEGHPGQDWIRTMWIRTYTRLLSWAGPPDGGQSWYFVNFDRLKERRGFSELSAVARRRLSVDHLKPETSTSISDVTKEDSEVSDLYARLAQRAEDERAAVRGRQADSPCSAA